MRPFRAVGPSVSGHPVSAASAVLDLANGLEQDKSVVTALFALDLVRDAGGSDGDQRAAFWGALLRHLGCTAFAGSESRLAEDDISLRSRLIRSDTSASGQVVAAIAGSNPTVWSGVLGVSRLALSARRLRVEWTQEACGAARLLAEQLGFGSDVIRVVDEAFERWDGRGSPRGIGGTDLSFAGRAANVAHVAIVFWLDGGSALGAEVLETRSGTVLDPGFVRRAIALLPSLELADPSIEADPMIGLGPPVAADTVAAVFGDFADLQSPFTRGHSRRVAEVADHAAAGLGVDDADRRTLSLAAHLHDVGQVAVPTGLWLVPRPWRPVERSRSLGHPSVTERVFAAAPAFADAARVAGLHHERLDGTGYPRGVSGSAVPRLARLLAAADVVVALGEDRPHRPALDRAAVRTTAAEMVRSGWLDGDCTAATLAAVGEPRAARLAGPVAALTAREVDVLRHLAVGRTNKEIASALGISDRTVQHHTIHIYEKLGIDTRAAAALIAARHGLV